MVDFSNYRPTPVMVVRAIAQGHRLTDEDLLEVLERCKLPLGRGESAAAHKLLNPLAERRGRPPRGHISLAVLIRTLRHLRDKGIEPEFLDVILRRLERGKPYTRADSYLAYERKWWRPQRDMTIRSLYHEVYNSLEGDPSSIEHADLGSMQVPQDVRRTRSETAIKLAHDLLAERTRMWVPAESTMAKIIAQDPVRKRRPRR